MSSVFFYSAIYTIQEEENPSGFYVDPQRHKSVFPNKKIGIKFLRLIPITC